MKNFTCKQSQYKFEQGREHILNQNIHCEKRRDNDDRHEDGNQNPQARPLADF
jgi:hypothetical protein